MKIGDLITIDGINYRILQQDSKNFCLNNLSNGGVISHIAWTMNYLENYFAEESIKYDVTHKTIGIYTL